MSLKHQILNLLNNEKQAIFAYLLNTTLLILIFSLMLDKPSFLYPFSVSMTVLIIYIIFKTVRFNTFLKDLEAAKTQADGLNADNFSEKAVFSVIDEIHRNYGTQLSELKERLDGRNSLFSQFVHNMKSSVAIIGLACEKNSESVISDISMENEKLKKNLEHALNILRLDEFSNDFKYEKVNLSDIVKEVINDKKRDFIYSKTYPKFENTDAPVGTDRKWCAFIIDQIISNAIKYSNAEKNIYFSISQNSDKTVLSIRDEGIGILPEDMPRIFDLFYTGTNGRQSRESTGIGLSMVKHICKKLCHEVSVESQPGHGTTVKISF